MPLYSYAEILGDTEAEARAREREALSEAIVQLQRAEEMGFGSREGIEALFTVNRLWSFLIEDLGRPENSLPDHVRAGLISVGIWVLKEAERIRDGGVQSFAPLIEVTTIIRDGLR